MDDFFCAAPWRGLHINPRGDVKTCCAGDPNMLGNLNEQSIEQILHGPVMQEIRQSICEGKPHAYCYNCVQAERYGRSERDWHNSVSPEFDPRTANDTEHVPTLIDVRWNTTCNLSCNYCGDKCSSKWAALKHIPFKSGARPYYEQVCDYLLQHQSNIREVALVGGEPLLLPENERLLDVIPDDCVVTLITNMSVDFDNNKIFHKLYKRTRVGWSMSFDNIQDRFEYVRHGASWALLKKNILKVKELFSKGHWAGIHAVYNIYNATRLMEFLDWAKSIGIDTHWQSLYQPEYLDPLRLGPLVRELAVKELNLVLSRTDLTTSERTFFEQALKNYQAFSTENLLEQFQNHIKEIEYTYHKTQRGWFDKFWPELATPISTYFFAVPSYLTNKEQPKPIEWMPMDTKELFEKNLIDSTQKNKLEQYGWLNKKITYNLNNYGFRTTEFTETENFIALGCSFTFGIGLPEEEIWTSLLSNQLNLKNWNLGVPGSSSDTSYRLSKYFIPMLKPKFVVMLEPPDNRLEICNHGSPNTVTGTNNQAWGDQHFLKTWFLHDENNYLRAEKNKQAIAYLCNQHNIDFYCYSSDCITMHNNTSFARDLQHPGTTAHIKFADCVYQDIVTKRTYGT
jgi:MoaA/NifB/PqqE/SkfB family radical SAM enzyme